MISFRDLRERLRNAPHGELRLIERATGVSYAAIRRIKDNDQHNPRINTVERISAYYESGDAPGRFLPAVSAGRP